MPSLLRRRRSCLVDLHGPSAEPFRTLRLALDIRRERRTGNVVVVTSPNAGEGKTVVATNYALVAAQTSQSVLLIDGDLRRAAVHTRFGLERSPGLVELLADSVDIRQYAHAVPEAGGSLDVLPAGQPIPGSGDIVSSRRMGEVIRQASENYDLVVIDSPPLLNTVDAAGFAAFPGVDVVIVVDQGSRRRPLVKALRKLELLEANVAGIVVNREGALRPYEY